MVVVSMQLSGVTEAEFEDPDVQLAFKKSVASTVGATPDEVRLHTPAATATLAATGYAGNTGHLTLLLRPTP